LNKPRLGYTIQYTLYREITAVLSEYDSKRIKALCGQNKERLNVMSDGE